MSAFKSHKKNKRLLFSCSSSTSSYYRFSYFISRYKQRNGMVTMRKQGKVRFYFQLYIIVVCDGSWCDAIWCVMARFVTVTSQSTKLSLFRLASLLKFQFSAEIQACAACTIWKKGIWCEIQSKSKLFEQRERCVIRFHQTATK